MDDKRRTAAVIVAKLIGKPEGGSEEKPGPDEGLMAAAEDLLAAVKAGDPEGVALALRDAIEMCGPGREDAE